MTHVSAPDGIKNRCPAQVMLESPHLPERNKSSLNGAAEMKRTYSTDTISCSLRIDTC